jgi:eukaryotic-like serine/threonine-protein kinase
MHAVGTGRLVAGRYRLQRPIGRGAMGVVWRGWDELLDRVVAVKEVRTSALMSDAETEASYQRTLREAKTAARLSHRGVVTVFDVVEDDGGPWIVMELVPARSLDQVIAEDGPLPPLRAARLGEILVSALACAHAAGVLHRDVKPSNVLLEPEPDGRAVLTDFGIAKMEGDPSLTQVGMVVGTPGFTAPERVCGMPATPASDLWSLGATLYAAVEGRGPFERAGGSTSIMAGVAAEEAPRAPSAGPLGPVIEALLRRDPQDRPDAATTARLLAEAAERMGPSARQAGGTLPDFMDAAAFPGVTEFPEMPATSELPESPELPAFLDLPAPTAGGQGPPWRQGEAADDQDEPEDADAGWAPEDVDAAWAADGPGAAEPHRHAGRGRLVLAGAVAAAIGAAAVLGYAALSGTPGAGSSAAGASGAPASHPARPGNPGGGLGSGGRAAGPAASAPAGYRWYRVSAASSGTAAGFRIAVPDSWQATRNGATSVMSGPAGADAIDVSVAPFTFPKPLREAHFLQARALAQGTYPGYQLIALLPTRFRGAAAAAWRFSWQQPGLGRTAVLELVFRLPTAAGPQAYTLAVSAPRAGFALARAIFATAVRTFRPVP